MRVLELFSGAGGATEGLLAAGLDVVRCVEWDRDADATAKAAGHPSVCGDVRDPALYADLPPIDLLWASPPCQAWSSAGKRLGAADERNGWPWTLDAIDRVRPTWAIFENVAGMLHHTGGCRCPHGPPEECAAAYFHRWILPRLRERFAFVDFRVLDAADYGVPQRRHRVFVVCGPSEFRWPAPTHADPATLGGLFGPRLKPWVTVREALGLGAGILAFGGGSNPHGKGREHERTERDLTDAPATTISAMESGNGGVWIAYARGRENGAVDERHSLNEPACALRGAPGGSSQPFLVGGHPVTVSRNGRARIEYALTDRPENVRGPSDLVRRHPVELLDAPANTLATGRPVYMLDPRHPEATPDAPSPTVRSGGDGHSAPPLWLRTAATDAGAWPDTQPAPTLSGKGNTYVHDRDPGVRRAGDRVGRASVIDNPAPTMCAGDGGKGCGQWSASAETRERWEQGSGRRRLTTAECAALQSFRPDYPWQGTQTAIYRQVGNAVPPLVAEALGRALLVTAAREAV